MRRIILITFLISLLISCKENRIKKDKQNENLLIKNVETNEKELINKNPLESTKGINFLKLFYEKFYFDDNDLTKFDSQNEFLSAKLIKKMDSLNSDPENIILDYDPFIQGQDFDGNLIRKSLRIEHKDNVYTATFELFEGEKIVVIYELILENDSKILINKILNDVNFK
jgi:hypothetical protein